EGKTLGDEGIVVRPNRAAVVAQGVERGLCGREGSHAPAAVHIRRHEAARDLAGAFAAYDAAPEEVPGIRGDGALGLLAAIERGGIEAAFGKPESPLEAVRQLRGLPLQAVRASGVVHGTQQARKTVA